MYKEERDVLREEKEVRKTEECEMEKFGTKFNSSGKKKTIAILGGKWWPRVAKQERDNSSNKVYVVWKQRVNAQLSGVSLLGAETVLRPERDAWSMAK